MDRTQQLGFFIRHLTVFASPNFQNIDNYFAGIQMTESAESENFKNTLIQFLVSLCNTAKERNSIKR
jgi:hypothetical protein